MRYWFDTEFDEQGSHIQLISIGIVAEDGRTYLASNAEYPTAQANDWLQNHVIPHLPPLSERKSRATMRQEVLAFFNPPPSEIWAYYGEYDWIVLRQLIGHMLDWPSGWPLSHMNLAQAWSSSGCPALPTQNPHTLHDALADALWCQQAWATLAIE